MSVDMIADNEERQCSTNSSSAMPLHWRRQQLCASRQ